ncbi:hypothetical protein LINGRAHAP2_LOCUS15903, partial [Linum grandiflorum]
MFLGRILLISACFSTFSIVSACFQVVTPQTGTLCVHFSSISHSGSDHWLPGGLIQNATVTVGLDCLHTTDS